LKEVLTGVIKAHGMGADNLPAKEAVARKLQELVMKLLAILARQPDAESDACTESEVDRWPLFASL